MCAYKKWMMKDELGDANEEPLSGFSEPEKNNSPPLEYDNHD